MTVVGLTGGIGTGKSTFAAICENLLSARLINADAVVHELHESVEVIRSIQQQFGAQVVVNGKPDRREIGRLVFSSPENRKWLEELLHPLVLRKIREGIKEEVAATDGAGIVIVEVPLLYEVDFPLERDIDVVVACAPGTQLQRVQRRNQLDEKGASERIAAQLPILEKVHRADVVIWNEGSRNLLNRQAQLLAGILNLQDS